MAAELVAAFVSRITILLVWKWAKGEMGEQQADARRFPIVAGQKKPNQPRTCGLLRKPSNSMPQPVLDAWEDVRDTPSRSHSSSFDQRRRPETLRTAIAMAFFWPTRTTSRLPRVMPV